MSRPIRCRRPERCPSHLTVAFEVLFGTEEQREAFRALPVARATLDAVPEPVNGLLIYRGRGGGGVTAAAG